ncbi:MAG: hypothetical protein EP330_14080 [Deltaproteobacteria bacterium]|nr:MAG: hypothetical protein EP330_14080 [Deltaproteobacteria bacterium]
MTIVRDLPPWAWGLGATLAAVQGGWAESSFLPPPGVVLGAWLTLAWGLAVTWLAWQAFGPRVVLREVAGELLLGDEPADPERRPALYRKLRRERPDERQVVWQEESLDRVAATVTHLRRASPKRGWWALASLLALAAGLVKVLGAPFLVTLAALALVAAVQEVVSGFLDMDAFRERARVVALRGAMVHVEGHEPIPASEVHQVEEDGEWVLVARGARGEERVLLRSAEVPAVYEEIARRQAELAGAVPPALDALVGRSTAEVGST